MDSTIAAVSPPRLKRIASVPAAIVAAAVVGDLASAGIAAVAHASGVPHAFPPLQFATFTGLIVLGVVCGAVGWQLVRSRATNPTLLLARLVPVVLLVSFVPDILVGVTKAETATTWGGVVSLMSMHVVVAAAAVASFRFFLPVAAPSGSAARGAATSG